MRTLRLPLPLLFLCCLMTAFTGLARSEETTPSEQFQGVWKVERHYFRSIREGEKDFEALGEETAKGKFRRMMQIRFRRHESGTIQQVWTDPAGTVIESKGITIFEATKNALIYRAWSDHPTWKNILKLNGDGTAVFQTRSLKHQETFVLAKAGGNKPSK